MRLAETVTFGGSGLDRAAEIRGQAEVLQAAIAQGQAETILLWRGKPLLEGAARARLARLPMDHVVLQDHGRSPLLLGREESGKLVFVSDISDWVPEEVDEAALGAFFDPSEQQHPMLEESQVFLELRGVMSQVSARDAELAATARAVLGWHRSHRFCAACGAESQMVMAGWQRSCPSCNTQHFPRTDPVVIMLITHGNAVLMGRSHGWPEGMYSLLAGFVEPGECLEAAVRREVFEEAAIKVGEVGYLASQPWPFPSSLMIGCYGRAETDEITIDPSEIEDARWFSREEVLLSFSGDHPTLKAARKGAIAHFLLSNWLADRLR
ncbi:NAD(+) diphosphatase [uncultured Lentibacter sp.]|uniref:NAD(+) diphosphatase n=1 Tax=uncultured Lentibacter sp. TaxID=1659309 RepID=UPI00261A8686|nr:NAD(+) diphosphatase [uncultured Lentibacter sp.]MCW1956699.1 NAD(+) diphosphatase [Roseobacter sp.]